MSATPLHPIFAPNGWVITGLHALPPSLAGAFFQAIIERPSTKTAIHAPGITPELAIAEAWRLAEIVENAGNV